MNHIRGSVIKLGHGIDTDIIIPARFLTLPLNEMKMYALTPIHPEFPSEVQQGNIIVAGRNFGCGSSREQAPAVLKALGISAIVAVSFARIFFRNAINLGIPVVECEEIYEHIEEGDEIEIDALRGSIRALSSERVFTGSKFPDFLMAIIEDGGLIPHIKILNYPEDYGSRYSNDSQRVPY